MRISDYIEQSFANLLKKKLRTFLTTFGVVIGIGALVSMFAFGKGMQKNVTGTFEELDLFNYMSVYPRSERAAARPSNPNSADNPGQQIRLLDDEFLSELAEIDGVEWAFPEIRFPALVRFGEKEEFTLVQALPTKICQAGYIRLRAGAFYSSDEEHCLIVSDSFLRRMSIKKPQTVIGQELELSTLTVDFGLSNIANVVSFLRGTGLPFSRQSYSFKTMKKISLTSVSDFFQSPQRQQGYSAVGVKLSSPRYVETVKEQLEESGFRTFAFVDQFEEIKKVFFFMDMFLFAIGMIAIFISALGIINTMVMSILERYKEIGIMKAVGASDLDVRRIFLFESGMIGLLGGVFGLLLGWMVSILINQLANHFTARQGVPKMDYFSFPWWLCVGAVGFSILVSLLAGVYPTLRAARVDPVVALRHD
jgi:putative ABC transport system permease protein